MLLHVSLQVLGHCVALVPRYRQGLRQASAQIVTRAPRPGGSRVTGWMRVLDGSRPAEKPLALVAVVTLPQYSVPHRDGSAAVPRRSPPTPEAPPPRRPTRIPPTGPPSPSRPPPHSARASLAPYGPAPHAPPLTPLNLNSAHPLSRDPCGPALQALFRMPERPAHPARPTPPRHSHPPRTRTPRPLRPGPPGPHPRPEHRLSLPRQTLAAHPGDRPAGPRPLPHSAPARPGSHTP